MKQHWTKLRVELFESAPGESPPVWRGEIFTTVFRDTTDQLAAVLMHELSADWLLQHVEGLRVSMKFQGGKWIEINISYNALRDAWKEVQSVAAFYEDTPPEDVRLWKPDTEDAIPNQP